MGLQPAHPDPDVLGIFEGDRPMPGDRVLDVNQADCPEGEPAVTHDCHVKREGQDVGEGGRQLFPETETADLRIVGDPVPLRRSSAAAAG